MQQEYLEDDQETYDIDLEEEHRRDLEDERKLRRMQERLREDDGS